MNNTESNKTELTEHTFSQKECNLITYRILLNLCAGPSFSGFPAIIDIIYDAYSSTSKIQFTGPNGVYSKYAKKYNTTASGMERDIRHLISRITTHGNHDAISKIFGSYAVQTGNNSKSFTTNSAFIYGIVNYIKYELCYTKTVLENAHHDSLCSLSQIMPNAFLASSENGIKDDTTKTIICKPAAVSK